MVGHKDRQYGRVFAARQTHGRAVHGLVHAEAAGRPLRGQLAQVATGGLGREHEGHDRGVGSDDHVLAQAGFETQARHAERAVLVIKVGIQGVVTRFGYAPGHAVVAAVLELAAHGPPAGALQQRAGITGHDQGGHKVFEHGARPRKQHGVAVHAGEQPAQRKPAILRQLPRGDGHKVSQAGFRGQQVVIGGVAAAFVDIVADAEQIATGVVQQVEVHIRQFRRASGQTVGQGHALDGQVAHLRGPNSGRFGQSARVEPGQSTPGGQAQTVVGEGDGCRQQNAVDIVMDVAALIDEGILPEGSVAAGLGAAGGL